MSQERRRIFCQQNSCRQCQNPGNPFQKTDPLHDNTVVSFSEFAVPTRMSRHTCELCPNSTFSHHERRQNGQLMKSPRSPPWRSTTSCLTGGRQLLGKTTVETGHAPFVGPGNLASHLSSTCVKRCSHRSEQAILEPTRREIIMVALRSTQTQKDSAENLKQPSVSATLWFIRATQQEQMAQVQMLLENQTKQH